jgi:hypothetical protein
MSPTAPWSTESTFVLWPIVVERKATRSVARRREPLLVAEKYPPATGACSMSNGPARCGWLPVPPRLCERRSHTSIGRRETGASSPRVGTRLG